MIITIEIKDNPRAHAPVKVTVDKTVHREVTVRALVSHIKKLHPWTKIIDIRVDLR